MARKLSRLARHGCWILVATVNISAIQIASAETKVRVSSPPAILPNPFAADAPQAEAIAVEPEAPGRRPTTFHNPFAHMPAAPPIEMPMRPGPVSRWRRPVVPGAEAAIKTAILSAEPTKPAPLAWDQLPPLDELIATKEAQQNAQDVTSPAGQGNSVRFAPQPLNQPAWVMQPADATEPLSPVDQAADTQAPIHDPFESANSPAVAPAIDVGSTANINDNPLESHAPPKATGNSNLLPMVISDYSDSPKGWFAEAQQMAQTAESIDDLLAIIELCQRALANGPPTELTGPLRRLAGWAHNRCGELQIDQGQESEAIRNFQVAISLDPNCSLAIHNRAVTLAQQNNAEAALRDFNRVIELNPGLAIAYRNRAELLASLDRFNEAVRDYTRAIDGLPDDAQLYRARGIALQRLGNFDHASADFDRALQLAPNDPDAYTQRGNLAAERGNFEQAVGDFGQAITIDANWAEAYRSLAWLHATCPDERFRDATEAVAAAERAVMLSPPADCFALDALAVAHASAGNFEDAARIAEQAIAIAPPDYVELLRQRLHHFQQGQPFINQPAEAVRAASHESPPRQ